MDRLLVDVLSADEPTDITGSELFELQEPTTLPATDVTGSMGSDSRLSDDRMILSKSIIFKDSPTCDDCTKSSTLFSTDSATRLFWPLVGGSVTVSLVGCIVA